MTALTETETRPTAPDLLPHYTEAERRTTLTGLMVVFLLAALSQNVVGTAMPRIIEDLHGFNLYAWVTTAYLLASTVMVPIYGKLSDLYGRKPVLIFGIVVFLLGSALCGLAGEPWMGNVLGGGMNQLIAFRAVAGFGGAALFTTAFTILADMFDPAERAKFGGLFGAIFGLSAVVGPVIGGFLTDTLSWRWTFYVNLPLGLFALFLIAAKMPRVGQRTGGKIDFWGAALILGATVPLLLALTWGGVTYPWTSPTILGLLGGALVSLLAFLYAETRASDPIIPLSLFRIPMFSTGNLASFVVGMAFFGVVMFLPLYMQMVLGVSPTASGMSMLPLMAGLMGSSILAGNLVAKSGNYKPWMIGGGILLVLGMWTLTGLHADSTLPDLYWRMFLVGLGLGPSQSLFTLAIQNAVPVRELGVATSSSQFFRQIGSTIGAAVFGTLLMNNLHTELPRHLPQMPGAQMDASNIDLGALRAAGSGQGGPGEKIKQAFSEQYTLIERALDGDAAAVRQVQANTQLPEELRTLATGGLQAQVHEKLSTQAAAIQSALAQGEPGREALLNRADTPEAFKTQLRELPAQALATPAAAQATAQQVSAGVLASEPQVYAQAKAQTLSTLKTQLDKEGSRLANEVNTGLKEGFTAAMTRMFGSAIWFAALGLLITLFVPVLPLVSRRSPAAGDTTNPDAPAVPN
ncbi:MDR family MFS transporter [Deinococcus radiophilus]|uniref:MFS transporter n=1 Tax=Deinococcus radiophilus TaxID=32062 RepID=A0A3S0I178_9DEIO|nr:MDR family MFS transporter [Deinococcus radiophilus]RTR24709.1 MFS transporter [Deinococcus radiophilus]UFA51638.1 MFS transporter [Deinococcus radiophilus]